MHYLSRRAAMFRMPLALAFVGELLRRDATRASEAQSIVDSDSWAEVRKIAKAYLDRERGAFPHPFEVNRTGKRTQRKVFAEYFPPMPLSFGNTPRPHDTYDDDYLNPWGAKGRFLSTGGYIAERPMPVAPWSKAFWQEINLAIDILRAQDAGVDAFSVDVLRLPFDKAKWSILKLYDTAEQVAPEFRLVPDIDHAALACLSPQLLSDSLITFESKPATYRLDDGRMLVTSFAPEKCSPQLWKDAIGLVESKGVRIAFMPVFLNTKGAAEYSPIAYGFSDWGHRDPITLGSSQDENRVAAVTGNKIWMEPVAPQDIRPKSNAFYESAGSLLFRSGWEKAIANNSRFVHVITWNDYSETTEVEPSTGAQYVFYDLLAFYAAWYKSGKEPRILHDALYYLHRQQIISTAQIQKGEPFELIGNTPLLNIVESIAFLTEPATLEIQQQNDIAKKQGHPGLNVFQVPACEGRPVFRIIRQSQKVVELHSDWEIVTNSRTFKPIYVGGSSNRRFVR